MDGLFIHLSARGTVEWATALGDAITIITSI
jgi:hypothetical protein